jgi:hypothetical protein
MQDILLLVLVIGVLYIGARLVSKIREMAHWNDEGDSEKAESALQPTELKSLTLESDHLDDISKLDIDSRETGEKKNGPPG